MKTILPTPPFFPGLTSLPNSLPAPPEWHRGMGNGACGQVITPWLCRSFLLTLYPCPSVGPFHGVQPLRNRLLQRGSPTGPQALPANLLRLLSPWDHSSCQEPALAQALPRVTASSRHPPAPAWGPPWAAGRDLLPRGPPWLQGQPVPPWSAPWLQGTLCSSTWSTSCPPSAPTLGSTELLLSHILTLLSGCSCLVFPPLFKHVISEAQPPWLISSALASSGSVLESRWHWLCRTWGKLLAASRRSHPCSPLLPKPCRAKPIQEQTIVLSGKILEC